jgi:hypothetical protein
MKALPEKLRDKLAIEAALEAHRLNGNPLHFWEAYRLCFEHKFPLPKELLAYFDGVAAELLKPKHADRRGKKETGRISEQALGLHTGKGRGTRFTEYHACAHEISIARDMQAEVEHRPNKTKEALAGEVAKRHGIGRRHGSPEASDSGKRRVLDIWRHYRQFLKVLADR